VETVRRRDYLARNVVEANQSADGTTFYACWVDSNPCEVLEFVHHPVASAEAKEISALLPCDRCRAAEKITLGQRLGRHQRRLLLLAPTPSNEPKIVPPAEGQPSAREAHRRAIRQLSRARLLDVSRKDIQTEVLRGYSGPLEEKFRTPPNQSGTALRPGDVIRGWRVESGPRYQHGLEFYSGRIVRPPRIARQTVSMCAVRLTRLGEVITSRLRRELERGSPIRWASHRSAILRAVRAETDELAAAFQTAFHERNHFLEDLRHRFGLLGSSSERSSQL
jgi:hypothetical protein